MPRSVSTRDGHGRRCVEIAFSFWTFIRLPHVLDLVIRHSSIVIAKYVYPPRGHGLLSNQNENLLS